MMDEKVSPLPLMIIAVADGMDVMAESSKCRPTSIVVPRIQLTLSSLSYSIMKTASKGWMGFHFGERERYSEEYQLGFLNVGKEFPLRCCVPGRFPGYVGPGVYQSLQTLDQEGQIYF